ncbi:MAG: peptide chain release factor N(5)-glutamine methyltransferase [bacterium]|nr:peptide chain release factor N(5)-glutamine methyltransferase [bacterium]
MNADVKTVRSLIRVTAEWLEGKGVDSAKLNAERLLADVLGLSRIELYMQHDRPVLGRELDVYRQLIKRRAAGEPLQTILGETEFYSRAFKVEPGVFVPRPETERLVETAAELLAPGDRNHIAPVAVEVGCGSGIIAVSLALEVPRLTLWATDVNPQAVALTKRNARTHGVDGRLTVLAGNRFTPLPEHLRGAVDLMVSNPPYVRTDDIEGLDREVAEHDPHTALDGGKDGLDYYRALAAGLGTWVRPGGWIAVEIGDDQAAEVQAIFAAAGTEESRVVKDYADRDRVVIARLSGGED